MTLDRGRIGRCPGLSHHSFLSARVESTSRSGMGFDVPAICFVALGMLSQGSFVVIVWLRHPEHSIQASIWAYNRTTCTALTVTCRLLSGIACERGALRVLGERRTEACATKILDDFGQVVHEVARSARQGGPEHMWRSGTRPLDRERSVAHPGGVTFLCIESIGLQGCTLIHSMW